MTNTDRVPDAECDVATARPWRLTLGILGVICFGYMGISSSSYGLGSLTTVGAGAFPLAVGVAGILASSWVVVEAAMGAGESKRPIARIDPAGWRRMVAFVAALALFPLLLTHVGFVTTAAVVTTLVVRLSGSPTWRSAATAGVIMTAVVYVLFGYVLSTPLPEFSL